MQQETNQAIIHCNTSPIMLNYRSYSIYLFRWQIVHSAILQDALIDISRSSVLSLSECTHRITFNTHKLSSVSIVNFTIWSQWSGEILWMTLKIGMWNESAGEHLPILSSGNCTGRILFKVLTTLPLKFKGF